MQAIYLINGSESFVSNTMSANRKTPEYPPLDCLWTVDQALVNDQRAEMVAEGNWSAYVQWKGMPARLSVQTIGFGINGKLRKDGIQ